MGVLFWAPASRPGASSTALFLLHVAPFRGFLMQHCAVIHPAVVPNFLLVCQRSSPRQNAAVCAVHPNALTHLPASAAVALQVCETEGGAVVAVHGLAWARKHLAAAGFDVRVEVQSVRASHASNGPLSDLEPHSGGGDEGESGEEWDGGRAHTVAPRVSRGAAGGAERHSPKPAGGAAAASGSGAHPRSGAAGNGATSTTSAGSGASSSGGGEQGEKLGRALCITAYLQPLDPAAPLQQSVALADEQVAARVMAAAAAQQQWKTAKRAKYPKPAAASGQRDFAAPRGDQPPWLQQQQRRRRQYRSPWAEASRGSDRWQRSYDEADDASGYWAPSHFGAPYRDDAVMSSMDVPATSSFDGGAGGPFAGPAAAHPTSAADDSAAESTAAVAPAEAPLGDGVDASPPAGRAAHRGGPRTGGDVITVVSRSGTRRRRSGSSGASSAAGGGGEGRVSVGGELGEELVLPWPSAPAVPDRQRVMSTS